MAALDIGGKISAIRRRDVSEQASEDRDRSLAAQDFLQPNQAREVRRPRPHHETPRDQVAVGIHPDASVTLALFDEGDKISNEHEMALAQLFG